MYIDIDVYIDIDAYIDLVVYIDIDVYHQLVTPVVDRCYQLMGPW